MKIEQRYIKCHCLFKRSNNRIFIFCIFLSLFYHLISLWYPMHFYTFNEPNINAHSFCVCNSVTTLSKYFLYSRYTSTIFFIKYVIADSISNSPLRKAIPDNTWWNFVLHYRITLFTSRVTCKKFQRISRMYIMYFLFSIFILSQQQLDLPY